MWRTLAGPAGLDLRTSSGSLPPQCWLLIWSVVMITSYHIMIISHHVMIISHHIMIISHLVTIISHCTIIISNCIIIISHYIKLFRIILWSLCITSNLIIPQCWLPMWSVIIIISHLWSQHTYPIASHDIVSSYAFIVRFGWHIH